jgi:hypothetical protein
VAAIAVPVAALAPAPLFEVEEGPWSSDFVWIKWQNCRPIAVTGVDLVEAGTNWGCA